MNRNLAALRILPALLLVQVAAPFGLPTAARAQLASLVADVNSAPAASESSSPRDFVRLGNRLVFTALDASAGHEPWSTSAGGADTLLLADTCAGECGLPFLLGSTGQIAFYESPADDVGSEERRLWRTDGTRNGTFALTPTAEHSGLLLRLGDSEPRSHAVLGDRLYFAACTAELGCELWATSPDATEIELVADLLPGAQSSSPYHLVAGDSVLFFAAIDDAGAHLAALDTTGQITFLPAATTEPPTLLATAGDLLFFVTRSEGQELWVSDGSEGGTIPLTDFAAPEPFTATPWLAPFEGGILFVADDVIHGNELWRSDGTRAGTARVTDFGFADPFGFPLADRFAAVDGGFVFWASDGLGNGGLWTSDGDPASTRRLEQVPQGFANPLVVLGGVALFVAESPLSGQDLWRSDGTSGGTDPHGPFCAPPCAVFVSQPVVRGDLAFFAVHDAAAGGWRLWSTDGTAQGTRLFAPASTPTLTDPLQLGRLDDEVFLAAATGASGQELWVLRPGVTAPITLDLNLGAPSSDPASLVVTGDEAYFSACDGERRILWRLPMDGAPRPVTGAPPLEGFCPTGPPPAALAAAGDTLVFATPPFAEPALWSAVGGVATRLLELSDDESLAAGLATLDGEVAYLLESDGRVELWATDGSAGGTRLVRALPEGVTFARDLRSDGQALFFVTNVGDSDHQLWISNGTEAGTRVLETFEGGAFWEPLVVVGVGTATFFVPRTFETGAELWVTDGTPAGTRLVRDLIPGVDGAQPSDLVAHDGRLFFFARTTDGGVGLWRSDGTSAGTVLVRRFEPPESNLFGPWETFATSSSPDLLFAFDDGFSGRELWISGGSSASTRRVRDLAPGPASSSPRSLFAIGGRVFFQAHDGRLGFELWSTDGTANGTRLVHDIAPGPASSRPRPLAAWGSRLLLNADDGVTGRELWSLETDERGCVESARSICLAAGRFRAEMAWRDFEGGAGLARAVALSADTGYFWFFDEDNVETILKVLDARGVNQHFWVFYGALSNVEYTLTVTDATNGTAQRYRNPLGIFASDGDVEAFGPRGARLSDGLEAPAARVGSAARRGARTEVGACVAHDQTLCLNSGRFAVRVAWRDFTGGTGAGRSVPITDDTGAFWFFDDANLELVLKVLDARAVNGRFWVFYGALSNVEYEVTVTDTETGEQRIYRNPLGEFASVGDVEAF